MVYVKLLDKSVYCGKCRWEMSLWYVVTVKDGKCPRYNPIGFIKDHGTVPGVREDTVVQRFKIHKTSPHCFSNSTWLGQ